MAINETVQLTQEQFLHYHSVTTIPNLVLLYIVSMLIFLGIGLSIVKQSRKKIFMIWVYSVILSAIFLVILIFFPNLTQDLINSIMGLGA